MQTKEFYNQIQEVESSLSTAIEENNSLEENYLKQLYDQGYKDRKTRIDNIFREIEKDLIQQKNLNSHTGFHQKISIEEEIMQLTGLLENKRNVLLQKIRQINQIHAQPKPTHNIHQTMKTFPRELCEKAQEYANLLEDEDLNENELIAYLARGRAEQNGEEVLAQIDELCKKRYQLNQLKASVQLLQRFKTHIFKSEQINPSLQNKTLSQIFEEVTNELPSIQSHQADQEGLRKWNEIQRLSDELQLDREQLMQNIQSDTAIPLPRELTNPEKEKEALNQALSCLVESNKRLIGYLEELRSNGIVTSAILPFEEVEHVYRRNIELKRQLQKA